VPSISTDFGNNWTKDDDAIGLVLFASQQGSRQTAVMYVAKFMFLYYENSWTPKTSARIGIDCHVSHGSRQTA